MQAVRTLRKASKLITPMEVAKAMSTAIVRNLGEQEKRYAGEGENGHSHNNTSDTNAGQNLEPETEAKQKSDYDIDRT